MPPKKPKEAIILLLDVGTNTAAIANTEKSFLNSAKECIFSIVQRKLFHGAKDEFCLILFGSENTKNKLKDLGKSYERVEVAQRLSLPTWELLRFVDKLEPTKHEGDWISALIVAVDYVQRHTQDKDFNEIKIVLFSNFMCDICDDSVDAVIDGMMALDIKLIVIGPDATDFDSGYGKTCSQKQNETLLSSVVTKVNGTVWSFEEATSLLKYYETKPVTPSPWNADLVISRKIRVPVSCYKKVTEPPHIKWLDAAIDDENAIITKERAYVRYNAEKGVSEPTEKEDVIDAYKFGDKAIPFSRIDKEAMRYPNDKKGLYLLGCTKKENTPLHMLLGTGNYIVTSRKGNEGAKVALEAFVVELYKKDKVGIVSKVYTDNSTPTLGVIFPTLTETQRYFVFTELPFAEDERKYWFPSLSTLPERDAQQKQIVEKLIDTMNLDPTDEHEELYDPLTMYDPGEQYLYQCIAFKALHPGEEIPDSIKDTVKNMTELSPELKEDSEPLISKIKELYDLQEEVSESKRKQQDSGVGESEDKTEEIIDKIGTEHPTRDFLALKKNGKLFSSLCQEMQEVIVQVISSSPEDTQKIITALSVLRDACIEEEPESFNSWMIKLKEFILEKNHKTLWSAIASERLGLITKIESEMSYTSEENGRKFLELKDEPMDYAQVSNTADDLWNEI